MESSQKRKENANQNLLIQKVEDILQSKVAKAAGFSVLLFLLLRLFFFELFTVNNRDMEGSYRTGDVLLIKKNAHPFARGEVILLEYPLTDSGQKSTLFIQRIAGLPGDTLLLSNKTLFVNGEIQVDPEQKKHNYFVKARVAKLDSAFLLRYGLDDGDLVSSGFDYSFALTSLQKEELEKDSLIEKINIKTEEKNMFDATCFPGSLHCNWNADQYGNIYVPKRNDTILLDTTQISLYEDIIGKHEQNKLLVSNDSIFINGIFTTYYVVKQNYYFTLGDNRDNAVDSRHYGFLPESLIRGKVLLRIFSARK